MSDLDKNLLKKNLLLFFNRPTEPCFMPKGNEKAAFMIPDSYYPDKFKSIISTIRCRIIKLAGRTVEVRDIPLPDLSLPKQLPYDALFSVFAPKHMEMAARLIEVMMDIQDLEDLQSICAYSQLNINPYMFNYCLSVVILHRPETKGLNIPNYTGTFPDKFVDPRVIMKAREITSRVYDGVPRPVITIPMNFTASDLEPEQKLAYFREDIGINLHHWHWHLVYPHKCPDKIVNKDRRGELFYYMHQQIICRYNAERLCNGMEFVSPMNDFRKPIAEGYFPKLDSLVASRVWAPRAVNSVLRDLDRADEGVKSDISELETWRDRFLTAVETQTILLPNGRQQHLHEETGIDILSNMMEASILSPNLDYYGNLHNMGHNFISLVHDPDHRHLEYNAVMGETSTAMRDPVFYRWHTYLDDLFQIYKSKLSPYSPELLGFWDISVSSVSIESPSGANTIGTRWEQSTVDLARGLDFVQDGPLLVAFTHLQHDEFDYVIEVNNKSCHPVMGTIRIFMAPVKDGSGVPFPFDEQRKLMIELDKFTKKISPGTNTIRRCSVDSSVTIPFEATFGKQPSGSGDSEEEDELNFCGCGWPQHLLVPKGNTAGYPMVLYVMISNWNDDKVEQDLEGCCNNAASYCGIKDRKYPDKRAMGFPFDRPAAASNLADFLMPNMATMNCSIRFTDKTRVRRQQ